jgi:hypothetical protein
MKFTPKDIEAITAAYDFYSNEKVRAFGRAFQSVSHEEVERVRTQLAVSGHFNPCWGISKPLGEALYAVLAGDAISDHDYQLLTDAVLGYD